jgi:hypothetical protein
MPVVGGLDPAIAEENGLLENIQLSLVLLASAVFLLRLRGVERDFRSVFYCGIFFGLACAMREKDVRPLDVPRWVELLGTGLGADIIIGSLCLATAFFVVKAILSLKRKILRIPGIYFGVLAIAAAAAMLVGDVFEKEFFGGDRAQIYEEYFETIGYFMLLIAALSAGSLQRISGMAQEIPGEAAFIATSKLPIKQ